MRIFPTSKIIIQVYYSRPVSVYKCHANSRAVVFHTLHIRRRETRLCIYLVNCATLYPLLLPNLWESYVLIPLLYSSISSLYTSATAADVSLTSLRSIPACYHQCIPTHASRCLSTASHRSMISRVTIYCANVFYLCLMQVSIGLNPASSIAASTKVYSHLMSDLRHGRCRVSCLATWCWKPPRTCPMQGVTTHVSAPKSNTDWTTA